MQNLHLWFVLCSASQIYGGDFAKFCDLLRIYELYKELFTFLFFLILGLESHMYASQWFLTVFTAKFPLYLVFRVLDVFLFDGFDAIFQVQPIFSYKIFDLKTKTKNSLHVQCGESLPHCYFTRLNTKRKSPF